MSDMERTDIVGWGIDLPDERRPGIPRRKEPHAAPGSHWKEPERQQGEPSVLMTAIRSEPTPVFGTAVPPRGLSGRLRRMAYRIPDNKASHWTTLLFADRVDVVESAFGELVATKKGKAVFGLIAFGAIWLARRRSRR